MVSEQGYLLRREDRIADEESDDAFWDAVGLAGSPDEATSSGDAVVL